MDAATEDMKVVGVREEEAEAKVRWRQTIGCFVWLALHASLLEMPFEKSKTRRYLMSVLLPEPSGL